MVVLIIACLHRLKGIAVVRVFQRQNHRPLLIAAVHIILQRHFQRYLNRHAAGIRKKAIVQIARQPGRQFF